METARILVVDDEEDLCEILQFNLETEGYEVEVAYSAEEALQKDIANFDLISFIRSLSPFASPVK